MSENHAPEHYHKPIPQTTYCHHCKQQSENKVQLERRAIPVYLSGNDILPAGLWQVEYCTNCKVMKRMSFQNS